MQRGHGGGRRGQGTNLLHRGTHRPAPAAARHPDSRGAVLRGPHRRLRGPDRPLLGTGQQPLLPEPEAWDQRREPGPILNRPGLAAPVSGAGSHQIRD